MKSLKKNFLYSGFLTTANYIFPLLVFPYVSRVLGLNNIGLCNFIDSIINYFILISAMGVAVVGVRGVAACLKDRNKLDGVFTTLLTLNGVSTLLMLVALVVCTILIPRLRENLDLMVFGGFKLIFNFFLIEWFYRGMENFKYITLRTLIVKCFYVVGVYLFVREADDYPIYYLLTCGTICINAIINIVHSRKFATFRWSRLSVKSMIGPYFIYGSSTLLISLYTTFNVTYLGFVTDDGQVGNYTTATKLFSIVIAMFGAFTGVMLPRMCALLAEGKRDEFRASYSKSVEILASVTLPAVFFTMGLAPQIIRVIAGNEFGGAVTPMLVVMPLVFIIGYEQIMIVQTLLPLGRDKMVLFGSIAGAVVGITANIVLVPRLMAVGSALAWLLSEVTVMVIAQYNVKRCVGEGFPFGSVFKYAVSNSPLLLLCLLPRMSTLSDLGILIISALVALVFFLTLQLSLFRDGACAGLIRGFINRA